MESINIFKCTLLDVTFYGVWLIYFRDSRKNKWHAFVL